MGLGLVCLLGPPQFLIVTSEADTSNPYMPWIQCTVLPQRRVAYIRVVPKTVGVTGFVINCHVADSQRIVVAD